MATEYELSTLVQTGFTKIKETFYKNNKLEERDMIFGEEWFPKDCI